MPAPLVLDYEWPAATSMADVAGPGALIAVLLGVTVYGLARRSPAAFAGAWFFLILAPTSSVLPGRNVLRADEPRPGLDLEALLSNAPQVEDDQFRVPPVLE